MDKAARTLLDEALGLDVNERANLAAEPLRSLDEPASDSQEEIDRLWAIEIEHRSSRALSGKSHSEPWDDVRSRIESDLATRDSADRTANDTPNDLW
jgi:hypothetical protein